MRLKQTNEGYEIIATNGDEKVHLLWLLDLLFPHSLRLDCTVIDDDAPDRVSSCRVVLNNLTDEQRADLFAEYCMFCGSKNPSCSCMRDG